MPKGGFKETLRNLGQTIKDTVNDPVGRDLADGISLEEAQARHRVRMLRREQEKMGTLPSETVIVPRNPDGSITIPESALTPNGEVLLSKLPQGIWTGTRRDNYVTPDGKPVTGVIH